MIEADLVTVTTPTLAEYIYPFNPHVCVLPNYLDDQSWKLRPPQEKPSAAPVTIGYMGSNTHQPDLESITPVVANLMQWGGQWYGTNNDHDAQVLYYRKDIIEDPKWQAAYKEETGEDMPVAMDTWEDVIKVAHFIGKLSLGEADLLRRAMSGKMRSRDAMRALRDRFFEGCSSQGIPEHATVEI